MSNKNVEFLGMTLKSCKGQVLPCQNLQAMFMKVLNMYGVKSAKDPNCITLDLTPKVLPDSYLPKVLLDVYEMSDFMFARISKKKENNAMQRRNYVTLEADDVFTTAEMKKLGIEVFTYFYIDFKNGIISFVNAQDAPGPRIINYIFDEYYSGYEIDFLNIPNKDGIDILYSSKSAKISGYEFELPVPNAQYLQDVLELNEDEIVKIINDNTYKMTVTIKPEPYKYIETDNNKVKEIIDILKRKGNYDKSIIRAKTDAFNTRKYDLHAKFFTYPIKIKSYKKQAGERVAYTNSEMKEQFHEGLVEAYNKNQDLILAIVNR